MLRKSCLFPLKVVHMGKKINTVLSTLAYYFFHLGNLILSIQYYMPATMLISPSLLKPITFAPLPEMIH